MSLFATVFFNRKTKLQPSGNLLGWKMKNKCSCPVRARVKMAKSTAEIQPSTVLVSIVNFLAHDNCKGVKFDIFIRLNYHNNPILLPGPICNAFRIIFVCIYRTNNMALFAVNCYSDEQAITDRQSWAEPEASGGINTWSREQHRGFFFSLLFCGIKKEDLASLFTH